MNEIQIFKNENFGEVRVTEVNGEPMFCLVDVAKALGYARPADAVSTHCKGVSILPTPTNGGIQQIKFGRDSEVFRLVMKSKIPEAEKFQDWVCEDVLPSIRKTGSYAMAMPKNYAEALRQLADTVEEKEKIQLQLTEKTEQLDESKDWYSIKRWAKMHRKNWRKYDWRKLKAVSHELGYGVKKIFDGNYDEVNIYHRIVFEAVYGQ